MLMLGRAARACRSPANEPTCTSVGAIDGGAYDLDCMRMLPWLSVSKIRRLCLRGMAAAAKTTLLSDVQELQRAMAMQRWKTLL